MFTNRSQLVIAERITKPNAELWWTWYVSGYRGTQLISAKAVNSSQAEYIADLFRKDGFRKIVVRNHGATSS
jgi:hypothetical protein